MQTEYALKKAPAAKDSSAAAERKKAVISGVCMLISAVFCCIFSFIWYNGKHDEGESVVCQSSESMPFAARHAFGGDKLRPPEYAGERI
ncbi:MAG: hypothetical protein IJ381_03640 [Clostridia bacterium]|nr:hypothetical protein [Clostridia bacterium]